MGTKRNLNDLPPTPWKNGGGITRELIRLPEGSDLDSFMLRVSVADVDIDAPFSEFPGIDRTLLILQGAGLKLVEKSTGTTWETLGTCLSPVHFEGEKPLVGCLVDGSIRDFNLMVRRGAAKGDLQVVEGPVSLPLANCHCVFMARGKGSLMQGDMALETLQEFDFTTPPAGTRLVIGEKAIALVVSAEIF